MFCCIKPQQIHKLTPKIIHSNLLTHNFVNKSTIIKAFDLNWKLLHHLTTNHTSFMIYIWKIKILFKQFWTHPLFAGIWNRLMNLIDYLQITTLGTINYIHNCLYLSCAYWKWLLIPTAVICSKKQTFICKVISFQTWSISEHVVIMKNCFDT